MSCEVAENLVRIRRYDCSCLPVRLNQILEWPHVVGLATNNTKHVFRDFVVSRCLSEVTVERQSDTCFERCELAFSEEGEIFVEGYVRIISCRPTGILFTAELWIEREGEVNLVSGPGAIEEIAERPLDLLEKRFVLGHQRMLRVGRFSHGPANLMSLVRKTSPKRRRDPA